MKKSNIKNEIKLIINRLKKVAIVKSDGELAEILNTNPNTFSSWKNQNFQIPLDNLIDFCNIYKTDLDFILFGRSNDYSRLSIPFLEDLEESLSEEIIHSQKHITLPITNLKITTHNLMCFKSVDNQLPITAPKDSYIIVDLDSKNAGWGCELFLISTDYGYLLRKLIAVPAAAENYDFILKSENPDIQDFPLSKLKIIGKVVGSLNLGEFHETTI